MDCVGIDTDQDRYLCKPLLDSLLIAASHVIFCGDSDTSGHPILVFTSPYATVLCNERIVFCSRDVFLEPIVEWRIWTATAALAALTACNGLHVRESRELLLAIVDEVDTFDESNGCEGIGSLAVTLVLHGSDGAHFHPVDGLVCGVVAELE